MIVSGSADFSVKLWNLKTQKVVKTLKDFSHWIVNLELKHSKDHEIESFESKNILFAMTKDFITCYSWDTIEDMTKNYQISLNPTDCLVWKNSFFTPGMQVFGQKVAYIRQVAMFDTHTVGDADLIIVDANDGKMLNSFHINQKIRKLLAVGEKFAMVLLPYVNER